MSYKIQTYVLLPLVGVFGWGWGFFSDWLSFPQSAVVAFYLYMLSTNFPLLGCPFYC